jgi:DNA-binding NtrC family response regulator
MNPSGDCTLTHRILFVGDDPYVLEGYRRMLHDDFPIETAAGVKQAWATMQMFGPFAVVVSEMRMSGLNGVEFFARVRELEPDTVGILLTGSRNHGQAVRAVKLRRVFHYLVKPCGKNEFVIAIRLGLAQYRINLEAAELIKEANAYRLSAASSHTQENLLVEE